MVTVAVPPARGIKEPERSPLLIFRAVMTDDKVITSRDPEPPRILRWNRLDCSSES